MRIVYDTGLRHIPTYDNLEPLVDIRSANECIMVSLMPESRKFFKKNQCLVRKTVAEKLARIQNKLHEFRLVIFDGFRALELQKLLYDKQLKIFHAQHQQLSKEKLNKLCQRFVAPVTEGVIPPHCTGGAVDLTLVRQGKQLDMGTLWGEMSSRSRTQSREITKKARLNRNLLIKAMKTEGFCNYPFEWWHWSYGDRYWAMKNRMKISIYGCTDNEYKAYMRK